MGCVGAWAVLRLKQCGWLLTVMAAEVKVNDDFKDVPPFAGSGA
jgi:hypothetical protein